MSEKQLECPLRYLFRAYHIAETLKLKEIDRLFGGKARKQSSTELFYEEDVGSYFFIYRFGSVIFFNVRPERQREVIEKIKMLVGDRPDLLTSEEFALEVRPDGKNAVGFELATVDELEFNRIELLALILAQSTSLEYFEIKVDEMLRLTSDIGHALKERGTLMQRSKNIKQFIGQCITTKQQLVSSLYLLDKPDATWNDQILDTLYRDASDMFEIKERYKTLDYKLRMVQESLELIAELLQHKNANRLEWAIIVLIAFEIVLFILQMFVLKP